MGRGRLVAIEGLDGAGKRTLADGLTTALGALGASVARMAFPRYGQSVHADLTRDALYGRMGDLSESVHGMAVLFALDRRNAGAELRRLCERHDIVLLDRYVASNAAYGAARLPPAAAAGFVDWVRALEIDRFAVPVPDLQLLLRVPVPVAASRARQRALTETDRPTDRFEADSVLQARCAAVYDRLTATDWLTRWVALEAVATPGVSHDLATSLLEG